MTVPDSITSAIDSWGHDQYDLGHGDGVASCDQVVAELNKTLAQAVKDRDAALAALAAATGFPTPDVQISPGQTPVVGKVNQLTGTFPAANWTFPNGTVTTLMAAPGTTVILDGQGKVKRAITAGGKLNLLGDIQVVNYIPDPSTGISCVPVYYGGTSAGSVINGLTISKSKQAGLAFQVPLVLTKLTVNDCGYAGILYTTADGTTFGDVKVNRVNLSRTPHDGLVSGIKGARSANVVMGPDVVVTDTGGANGIWFDVSCRNPTVNGSKVLTGGGIPAYFGLLLEETEGGTVVNGEFEGQYNSITATGHVSLWNNKLTGTIIGLQVRQDRGKNSGTNPANLTQAQAPWWTVGNALYNNTLTGPTAFAVWSNSTYGLAAKDMVTTLKGNTFSGKVSLGDTTGKRSDYTPAQLATLYGSAYDSAKQPVPTNLR